MGVIEIFQETSSLDTNRLQNLSVALGETWLSYALHDREGDHYKFGSYTVENVSDAINALLLKYPGRRTKFALCSTDNALVPGEMFSNKSPDVYIANREIVSGQTSALSDTVYSQGIKNVYGNVAVASEVQKDADASVCHILTPLLSYLPRTGKHTFLVWLHDKSIHIATEDNRILFAEIKTSRTIEDVMYNVVATFKGAGLDMYDTRLLVMGRFEHGSELHTALIRYIPKMDFLRVPGVPAEQGHLFYDMYLLSKYL